VAGDAFHEVDGRQEACAQGVAEAAEIVGDEQAVVVGGDLRFGFGQHHLDQLDGRAEERPLLHHRGEHRLAACLECVVHAEPGRQQQAVLCPRELPRNGA
jgi:hypothetical protein